MCIYQDQSMYMGFWEKNKTHGIGLKILSNGIAYEANFLDGMLA